MAFFWSSQLDKGLEACRLGDYQRALRLLRPVAEKGHALAQTSLGTMFRKGLGTTIDYEQAFNRYRELAEKGMAAAQCDYARMHHVGLGVPQDFAKALYWYQQAAAQ